MSSATEQVEMASASSRYHSGYVIQASALVILLPVALWGTGLIIDYPGPPGPLGWTEILGWWFLCLLAGFSCSRLMLRWDGVIGFLVSLLPPLFLGMATYLDVQPGTPPVIKDTVEYGLQGIGLLALLLAAAVLGRAAIGRVKR